MSALAFHGSPLSGTEPAAWANHASLTAGSQLGLFQDISKRKRDEAWESYKVAIWRALTNHLELATVLTMTADAFVGLYPSCSVAFFEREGKTLKLIAHSRIPDSLLQSLSTGEIGDLTSACLLAAEQGKEKVIVRDLLDENASCCRELSESSFTSCLAVPVFSGARNVVGVVAYFSPDAEPVDILVKEHSSRICDVARLAIEQHHLYANLLHQSQHDHLTGLPNRLLLEDRLEQALMRARRHGTQLAVCYMDLDQFKLVNDTLGHTTGDAVLQHVACVLKTNLRESDTISRHGGDEFILILPNLNADTEAEEACERIMNCLRQSVKIDGHTLLPTVSIGISIYPDDGETPLALIQNADFALYAAKHSGRDKVQRFASKLGESMRRSSELRFALELNQFSVAYQPLYSRHRTLKGFEALLRWSHPVLGQVGPDQFIPLAEKSGLILPIGEWVLEEACRQAQEWNAISNEPVKMFVNISCVQLAQASFVEIVARALSRTGLDPTLLELEITETWILEDTATAAVRLAELRKLGLSISIDDFGSGHCNFNYLQQLPVDTIKIDRSFVSYLDGTTKKSAIIRAVMSLAEELGLQTVAEGIETQSQFNELQGSQCDLFQGYLFAHPLTPAKAGLLLRRADQTSAPSKETKEPVD